MNLTCEELPEALSGRKGSSHTSLSLASRKITGVSIDSRTLKSGELFICLRGEKTDGHHHIKQALELGASALLVEEDYKDTSLLFEEKYPEVAVFRQKNNLIALQNLAYYHRQKHVNAQVIGITGSNGKTSTKEILAALLIILTGKGSVAYTSGNLNNHYGLPLSLLKIEKKQKYAIMEMGMNHAGEIRQLSQLACPHHAIITCIAGAHHEYFIDLKDIADAKLEILEGMKDSMGILAYHAYSKGGELAQEIIKNYKDLELLFFGTYFPTQSTFFNNDGGEDSFINNNDAIYNKLPMRPHHPTFITKEALHLAEIIQVDREGMHLKWMGEKLYAPHLFLPEMATNLVACLSLLGKLGFMMKDIKQSVLELRLPKQRRFDVIPKLRHKKPPQILIDDSYNANPASFIAAIYALRGLLPNGILAICMGEMGELGDFALSGHQAVVEALCRANVQFLALSTGEFTEELTKTFLNKNKQGQILSAQNASELVKLLENQGKWESFDGILVKGSRNSRMDIISDYIHDLSYN